MKTINLIKSHYHKLTKTEKKIADGILGDVERTITQMSTSELAQSLDVGEASIVRFCRKLGFDGYVDLKIALAVDYSTEAAEANSGTYLGALYNECRSALNDTYSRIDTEAVKGAVELLMGARRIFTYGVASSGIMAAIAEERLMRTGVVAKSVCETHLQHMQSTLCSEGDVLMVFSVSGSSWDINDAVAIARENGAKVIGMTCYPTSALAGLSNVVLLSAGPDRIVEGGDFATMTSMLFLIGAVCRSISHLDPVKATRSKEQITRAVSVFKKY